jgi:hypothetical protein
MSDKPVKKIRIGLITATVWRNENEGGKAFYTVNMQRQYKNSAGEWQAGDSYNHDDLLNLAKVAERAEAWISEQ